MAEKKLYRPKELELLPILLEGEIQISGLELLYRVGYGASSGWCPSPEWASNRKKWNSNNWGFEMVMGTESQVNYLWNRRDEFPKEWRVFKIAIPDKETRNFGLLSPTFPVFFWTKYHRSWFSHDYGINHLIYEDFCLPCFRKKS